MYNIGIIDKINPKGLEVFKNKSNFKYEVITDLSKNNLLKKLPEFDGITLRRSRMNAELLSNCKKLKVISRHGVGYDNVDLDYIKKNDIKLLVTNSSTSTSPAEHIMYMILSIYKGVNTFDSIVRSGSFSEAINLDMKENFELCNKNILIVGFGRIGKKLIKKCLGFDLKVSVFDPAVDEEIIKSHGGTKVLNLIESLKKTDILSLSIPKNEKTHNLISLKEMKIMKKNSIIINISRGGIVNEEDLNFALNNRIIFYAGIDVFEKEPPDENNPLLSNKRVLLSPHAATFTKECLENMSIETVNNIIDFFEEKIDKSKIVNL
ncbi:MAG: hydroxyacid dehydrogenase [Candidatus Pelagibacter sp. TMED263]|nr:MAG: hydroxyacid dehydrogenase [Candidatus Pelagibacter sp. TMED263]